jgi:hypothetical protein
LLRFRQRQQRRRRRRRHGQTRRIVVIVAAERRAGIVAHKHRNARHVGFGDGHFPEHEGAAAARRYVARVVLGGVGVEGLLQRVVAQLETRAAVEAVAEFNGEVNSTLMWNTDVRWW